MYFEYPFEIMVMVAALVFLVMNWRWVLVTLVWSMLAVMVLTIVSLIILAIAGPDALQSFMDQLYNITEII